MKFLKKLLYFFVFLFALFCAFVILCAFRPDITESVAHFLYPEKTSESIQNKTTSSVDTLNTPAVTPEASSLAEGLASDYHAPNQEDLIIPYNVSGRNGYQQIQDSGEELAEESALTLQTQLDTGNEGDGLTFDSTVYPYYAMLSETQQHIYRQIYANANDLYAVFSPVEPISSPSLKNVFSAVYNDHPELFWLETAYTYKYMGNGQCVEIGLLFNRTSHDLDTAKFLFEENANQIITQAESVSNSYEKEKVVHNALIDKLEYNLNAEMNQSAYSALVNRDTVCAGYSRAFQYILQKLGIPAYYCTGFAGESHAWNIVGLEGEFYNVDTTWADTGAGIYDYFNKSDDDYASTHIRQDLSVYLPPCNGSTFRDLEITETESKKDIIQDTPSVSLRTLDDLGMTEAEVLTSLDAYYKDCLAQIIDNGKGNYTFSNVVKNADLLAETARSYQSEAVNNGYLNDALKKTSASRLDVNCSAEALEGKYYLVIHEVSLD